MRYDGSIVPPQSTRPVSIRLTTPSASYEIVIAAGLLASLEPRLKKLVGGKLPRLFIVTSPEIWGLWSKQVLASFLASRNKQSPTVLFLPSGERSSSRLPVRIATRSCSLWAAA